MNVREIEDRQAVLDFLTLSFYPYPWTMEGLASHRILEISNDEVVGYVWFSERTKGVMEIHVCVSPPFAGRWMSRALLLKLCDIGREIGTHTVVGLIDRPIIERIYRRLGASIAGPFAILKIEDLYNGLYGSKDCSPRACSTPAA